MKRYPLISIVSTLYNYRRYVGDMIRSCLGQTYPHWELVIVDDASTDNPYPVIKKHKDKRIQYVRLDSNSGYACAKNEGIVRTKGEFIVMIDADDFLTGKSLHHRYNTLLKNPKNLWTHGQVYYYNDQTKKKSKDTARLAKLRRFQASEEKDYRNGYHRCVHAQGIMVRREFHSKLGLYDEDLRASADKEMWLRALWSKNLPVFCEHYVAYYRKHPNQMHKSKFKKKNKAWLAKVVREKVAERLEQGISSENTRLLDA